MNPTHEQVAAWAREAGIPIGPLDDDYCKAVGLPLGTMCNVDGIGMEEVTRLVTRAMAEQAELCAADLKRAKDECDAITELNHAQWLALENVQTLAAKYRTEPWAQHMLRFCEEAGVRAQALRANAPKVTM